MKDDSNTSLPPTIAQLRSHSLTAVVQHEIERMILSGELPAGTRLKESVLARKLSVSRGPVREACRALAELGFVYLFPNRGVFVKRLDRADAMEVYDLRAGLTGLAGSLLAPMVTDRHIDYLQQLLDEMDGAADVSDFPAFNLTNLEFHDFIVDAAGNGRLTKTYRGLVKEFQLYRTHGLARQHAMVVSNKEHRAIVEALKKGDGSACYAASFQHVANGKNRMMMALDDLAVSGVAEPTSDKTVSVSRRSRPLAS